MTGLMLGTVLVAIAAALFAKLWLTSRNNEAGLREAATILRSHHDELERKRRCEREDIVTALIVHTELSAREAVLGEGDIELRVVADTFRRIVLVDGDFHPVDIEADLRRLWRMDAEAVKHPFPLSAVPDGKSDAVHMYMNNDWRAVFVCEPHKSLRYYPWDEDRDITLEGRYQGYPIVMKRGGSYPPPTGVRENT